MANWQVEKKLAGIRMPETQVACMMTVSRESEEVHAAG